MSSGSHRLLLALAVASATACAPTTVRTAPSPTTSAARTVRVNDFARLAQLIGDRCYPGKQDPSFAATSPAASPANNGIPRWLGLLAGMGERGWTARTRLSRHAIPAAFASQARVSASRVADLELLSDIVVAIAEPDGIIVAGPGAKGADRFRADDWYATFRAIAGPEAPGVSIDPGPNPNLMQVRYLGNIQKTAMGETFFEADRTLKLLSTGFDNLNCASWPNFPPGLVTELDLMDEEVGDGTRASSTEGQWHRYWFEPNQNYLETEENTILIPEDRMWVKEESVPPGRPSPRSASQFAAAVSSGFRGVLAERVPSFRDLQRQAALISLAKWVRDKEVVIDQDWYQGTPAVAETTDTTPSITVLRAKMTDRLYLRYGIHGGVDFQRPNRYGPPSSRLRTLVAAVRSSAPSQASSWMVTADNQQYRAVRLPITRPSRMPNRTVVWTRVVARHLVQPGVLRVEVPFSNFLVTNETGSVVTLQLSGPTARTERIAAGAVDAPFRVITGSYKVQATSRCGQDNDTVVVREGERHKLRYWCETERVTAPPAPRVGSFVVRNNTGAAVTVAVGGRTYTAATGTSTIELPVGNYEATVTSRCGSTVERLNVTAGSTHEGQYSCVTTTMPRQAPAPRGGSFIVQNNTGAPLTVAVGGQTYTIPAGSSTISLAAGNYIATISTRCGTGSETLAIQEGTTFTGQYSCVRK